MKKLVWLIGGIILALLVAIISVPLFVDVDKYRPTIVSEANKRINGKLELGTLKLSLWGAIKIHADSIRLSVNGFPEPLVDTKQFHIEIPILSILTASPQVIAVLDAPKISVVKNSNGKMNVMELMKVEGAQTRSGSDSIGNHAAAPNKEPAKPAAAPSAASTPAAPAAHSASAEPTKVPALVAGAKLGLKIKEGDLHYSDKLTHSDYQVNGLDLDARNLGLGSTMDINVKAPVKGASPTMTFEGPITASAQLTPVLVANSVKSVRGQIDLDATKMAVEMKGGAFHKTDSMPLHLQAQFDGDDHETLMRALELQFADYKIHGKGRVVLEPMSAKVEISTDPGTIRLDKVESFVPMAEAYQLKGLADFNADVDWKPEALRVNGSLKVTEGSFFMKEMLKAPMQFKIQTGFSENSLNIARAAISAPETEIELTGNVRNFMAPQFSFALTGKSFNVDKTLVLPPPGATKTTQGFSIVPVAYAAGTPAPDVNPMLAMAKNPMIAGAGGTFTAQIGRVTAYGANFDQVNARVQLQSMMLKIPEAGLKTFGGSIHTNGEFDLKSVGLNFHSQGSVSGISAKEAFKTYFPKYQNTLEGNLDSTWNLSGALYPSTVRMHALKGTAKFVAKDGAVKSVDFQESINSAMAKVPFLKSQKPIKMDNGFKSMSADLRFDSGTIHAEPIEVLPRNQGFVIKGKSNILENLEQETLLDVYDPQGQLPKELQQPGKPALQLRIIGLITAPKTDYDYTVKKLASTAGKKMLQDQAGKALGGLLGGNKDSGSSGNTGDQLKKAADDLKKKFHF